MAKVVLLILFSVFLSHGLAQSVNCNFNQRNKCSFKDSKDDKFDWTLKSGSTPSGGTGPSSDVSGSGYYIYTEASNPRRSGDNARISTPYLSGPQCLKFYYHMRGQSMGTLKVVTNNDEIFKVTGNQGSQWVKTEVEIDESGTYKVTFEGIIGSNYHSDIAIDEITFTPGLCSGGPPPTQPPQPPQPPQPGSCGKRYLSSTKVVSGQTARPHSWPWQVTLRTASSGFHFCGGSLISDQWVLTAAHCLKNRAPSYLKVRLGEHNFDASEANEVDRTVERIIVHPNYARLNNDVALIKLSRKVTLKPQLSPVCLPNHGASVDEVTGQECYVTGWGRTGASRPGARVLQEARLPVISSSKCKQHMGSVTPQMVCAGFGGSSTVSGCMGDSGGPFVCRDKSTDRWYLHGAVSWGSRTCSAGKNEFTVFARVSEFVNWIKQYVGTVNPPQTPRPPPTPRPPQTRPPQTPPRPSTSRPTNPPQSSVRCNFDNGNTCLFTDDRVGDIFDWTIESGGTPSQDTGPSNDVSGSGSYAFIETSKPRRQNDNAKLTSPAVSGTQCVKFSYHMYGSGMGTLTVFQKTQSSTSEVFKMTGDQGNQWRSKEIQLSSNGRYNVVFEGKRGHNFLSDIAIDEISITPGKCSSGGTPPTPGPPTPGPPTPGPPTPAPPSPRPPSGKCGEKGRGLSDNPKIVGGQQATPGEWPWQVALLRGNFPFCGGSLVSNQYVITAAHCVKATDWNRVKIRVGEHELGKTEGHEQDISIARNGITVHPNYNRRTTDYDVAIIKFSRAIQHTQRIKPVCINSGTDFTGQRCYITGWGRLSSGGSSPKVLHEAQVPIVTRKDCQIAYGVSRITDRMICAGYPQGGTDTCQGDSGGPMVCKHSDGSWHLTGITSWGRGCASPRYYGVYAHVGNLYSWINQITGL